MHDLGVLLAAELNLDEANSLFVEASALSIGIYPDTHSFRLTLNCNHGRCLQRLGRLEEAEQMVRPVKTKAGERKENRAIACLVLGEIQYKWRKWKEAGSESQEAVDLFHQIYPPGHPYVCEPLTILTSALQHPNRNAEAEPHYRELLAGRARHNGPEHPNTLWVQNRLAVNLEEIGKNDEAGELYRKTWEARKTVHGPNHNLTLESEANLGGFLRRQRHLAEAEPLLKHSWEQRAIAEGCCDLEALNSCYQYALVFENRGRLDEAELLFRHVLAARRFALTNNDSQTLLTINNLAVFLQRRGVTDEAEELYREVIAIREKEFGEGDLGLATTRSNLARLLMNQGKHSNAVFLFKAVCNSERARQPMIDDRLAKALIELAGAVTDAGDPIGAEPFAQEALGILTRTRPKSQTRFETAGLLGSILMKQERLAEAEPLLVESARGLAELKDCPPRIIQEARVRLDRLCESWDPPSAMKHCK